MTHRIFQEDQFLEIRQNKLKLQKQLWKKIKLLESGHIATYSFTTVVDPLTFPLFFYIQITTSDIIVLL